LAPHRRFVKLFWLIRAIYVALGTTRRILKLIDSRWKRLGRRAAAFVKTDSDVCFARASAYREMYCFAASQSQMQPISALTDPVIGDLKRATKGRPFHPARD
jgi:hypothetical protein